MFFTFYSFDGGALLKKVNCAISSRKFDKYEKVV